MRPHAIPVHGRDMAIKNGALGGHRSANKRALTMTAPRGLQSGRGAWLAQRDDVVDLGVGVGVGCRQLMLVWVVLVMVFVVLVKASRTLVVASHYYYDYYYHHPQLISNSSQSRDLNDLFP